MKKLKYLIYLLFLMFFYQPVNALSTNLIASNSQMEQDVTITLQAKDASNLWGLQAKLNYDHDKLSLASSSGLNGFTATVGTNIVLDNSKGVNGTVKLATLKFKATNNFKIGEETTISIENVTGTDGVNITNGSGSQVTVKKAEAKSNNSYLSSLKVDQGSIQFNKDTLEYKLEVDYEINAITISGEAADSKAKVQGLGVKELNIYSNSFEVIVTAENGATRKYIIEVIRKDQNGNIKELSNENTLASLKIKNYDFAFDKDILEYTILLKDDEILDIEAIPTDEEATVSIENIDHFNVGNNIIKIKVVSASGQEKIYTINAVKTNSNEGKETNENTVYVWISIVVGAIVVAGAGIGFYLFKKSNKK